MIFLIRTFFRVAFEFVFLSLAILVLWENMLAEDQVQREEFRNGFKRTSKDDNTEVERFGQGVDRSPGCVRHAQRGSGQSHRQSQGNRL